MLLQSHVDTPPAITPNPLWRSPAFVAFCRFFNPADISNNIVVLYFLLFLHFITLQLVGSNIRLNLVQGHMPATHTLSGHA